MKDEITQQRILAVQRFLNGEKPESICASLGRSKAWLYKWVERHLEDDNSWSENRSRQPLNVINRTSKEIEEIIKMVRLNLYNRDLFCGAQAIIWELEDLGVKPVPTPRTINRVLSRNALTHRRTGKYEAKGTPYPKLPSLLPNQTHQADLVGPCYLKGPVRFYGLNVVDTATVRCGLYSSLTKAGQNILDGFWAIWKRLGIPDNIQVDNAMSFFGSPTHPRGMGPLIRLCLQNGVQPWFIPMAEPWRNGMIEQFNDLYQQKFLARVGAAIKMRVEDVYVQGRRTWVRLHEKGGKRHDMPCHHSLEEYLEAYIKGAGIAADVKGYLFRTAHGRSKELTDRPMSQADAYRMIRRRAAGVKILTKIGNHSFRATGITEYLRNGGMLEVAQQMANHESARTTGLYDRRNDQVSLDEIERIRI